MIEEDKLIFNDYEIISELTTFISKHNSFEAEEGCNDDLAMCLVIYAWLVQMDYFKELTDQDVRKRLYEEQKNQIEQDMAPFGFLNDGLGDDSFVDSEGDRWFTDEYGDGRSYMWENICCLMDLDGQIKLGHLFIIQDRKCRVCGETKNLVEEFYRTRKDRGTSRIFIFL